jgi:hypothetical protein
VPHARARIIATRPSTLFRAKHNSERFAHHAAQRRFPLDVQRCVRGIHCIAQDDFPLPQSVFISLDLWFQNLLLSLAPGH